MTVLSANAAHKGAYVQSSSKVIEATEEIAHVMALTFDPLSDYTRGIVRCIEKRVGDVNVPGYTDFSSLRFAEGNMSRMRLGNEVKIAEQDTVVESLRVGLPAGSQFLGLEDPDIVIEQLPEGGHRYHLYFSMPWKLPEESKSRNKCIVHLGHAEGPSLDQLTMTAPVVMASPDAMVAAKEVSLAPAAVGGLYYNLFEGGDCINETHYSTVQVAIAENLKGPWKVGDVAFHPLYNGHDIPWIAEHASPGPLLPASFIDIGPDRRVGLLNGRSLSWKNPETGQRQYGDFTIGLMVYNLAGKIEWISPEEFIRDTETTGITFASYFVDRGNGKGSIFAHVNDSFVRKYDVYVDRIKALLPEHYRRNLQTLSGEPSSETNEIPQYDTANWK